MCMNTVVVDRFDSTLAFHTVLAVESGVVYIIWEGRVLEGRACTKMQANATLVCDLIFYQTRLRLGTHGRFPLVCRRDTCEPPLLLRPGRVLSGRSGRRGGSDLGSRLLK